jgi:hypothetical protein
VVFLRRTAHVVSIVVLLSVAKCASAQSQPTPQAANDAVERERDDRLAIRDALGALSSQLGMLRDLHSRAEQRDINSHSDYWPPIWSNWFLFAAARLLRGMPPERCALSIAKSLKRRRLQMPPEKAPTRQRTLSPPIKKSNVLTSRSRIKTFTSLVVTMAWADLTERSLWQSA